MQKIIVRLLRQRGFAFAAIILLALGIGATVAVFSVINGVLLRPLPFDSADRLVDLAHSLQVSGATHVDQSDASFLYYRRSNRTLLDIGAYTATAVNLGPLRKADTDAAEGATRVMAARISGGT